MTVSNMVAIEVDTCMMWRSEDLFIPGASARYLKVLGLKGSLSSRIRHDGDIIPMIANALGAERRRRR